MQEKIAALKANIQSVVLGKSEPIDLLLTTLLAGGHLLLEDVPGIGKTLLARALAKTLDGRFHRIQFTSDLIPADITGGSLFDPKEQRFSFVPGPIFANILLADEINRTTPRTQSAMLEAMSERQVSCDGISHPLPDPFMVIATENPIEFEGTYPLPESQLDRFLLRISLGYPDRGSELEILRQHQDGEPVEHLRAVASLDDIRRLQELARQVRVAEELRAYIIDIVEATRRGEELQVGVSPRGSIALLRAAQAAALVAGRDFVIPDDIKRLAVPVLAHRVVPNQTFQTDRRAMVEELIGRLVERITVPV